MVNEQIETQATERGDEHEHVLITETIDDSGNDNLTSLLKNEINNNRTYQRPYFLHQRN